MKISKGTYKKICIALTRKSIKIIFFVIRSILQNKFSRNFIKLIPNLKSRSKDNRM